MVLRHFELMIAPRPTIPQEVDDITRFLKKRAEVEALNQSIQWYTAMLQMNAFNSKKSDEWSEFFATVWVPEAAAILLRAWQHGPCIVDWLHEGF
jgi:hypothetical protein